ncbi:MAG: diguanylate cyclase [Thermodesulfobacteriota bacterium]|nr:diguanylate cyclase [Thermodesulfobacteriota bacterium]
MNKGQKISLGRYAFAAIILWSIVISISLYVNYQINSKHLMDIGTTIARSSFEKDILYRRWNAAQGGVYGQESDLTIPNQHLYVAERDISTPLGKQLTMINPAYMTRQVHELGQKKNGIQGHITSLNPIRPENEPDSWERKSLESFETGVKEVSSIEILNGKSYLRWMRPLITEQGCLACHQQQGYKVGQIRGGISQSVPMSLLSQVMKGNLGALWFKHLLLWLIGSLFIYYFYRALLKKTLALSQANQQLGKLALTDVLTGLSNRRYAMQILEQLWDELLENSKPLACLMIDADGLKKINDSYGHDAGDIMLCALAKELQYAVRTDDIVCRLGGDEFLIICPNTDEEGAINIANMTHAKISELIVNVDGGVWQGSVSIGVAVKTGSMQNFEELITAADRGVYAAKEAGKNCVKMV